MFGYPAVDVIGRNVSMLMPSPHRELHDQYLEDYRRTGLRRIIGIGREVSGVRRDGSEFPLDLSVSEVQLADRRIYTGILRDISERRRVEAELKRTLADLARRNAELHDFAFVASHDLQEPLRKIHMFSDRLLARYGDVLDEQGRDFLARSQSAAKRMQTLIDDLLSYSRAAQGRPFAPVDLQALIADVVDDLEPRLELCEGQVSFDALPTVHGDASQLRQVFQNLLSNAIKFSSKGVPARVTVSARRALDEREEPCWRIEVADNGIGFDQAQAERIFVPFQRLHGAQQYDGTGIGLAIVRRIIERHRGHVSARSVPGQGATFTVTLPRERQAGPGGFAARPA
jgi:two-component system, LuxR family, sensor kinase FixL